jgi:hypothetical protein
VAHSLRSLAARRGLRPAGPPYTLARGDPTIPAPLVWLTRCARSRRAEGGHKTPPTLTSVVARCRARSGAGRPRPLKRAAAPRGRKTGDAIRRGEFRPCDPRRTHHHRRIGAPGVCREHHPYSPRRRAQREYERRPFSRLAEAGRRPPSAGAARKRQLSPRCPAFPDRSARSYLVEVAGGRGRGRASWRRPRILSRPRRTLRRGCDARVLAL